MSALGLFLLWLGYTIVSIGMWRLVPTIAGWDVVSYTDLAATTESLLQNVTIAQGVTAGLVVLLAPIHRRSQYCRMGRRDRSRRVDTRRHRGIVLLPFGFRQVQQRVGG